MYKYFCSQLNWKDCIKVDRSIVRKQRFSRIGNPVRLMKNTQWKPTVNFKEMVKIIIDTDLNKVKG